MADLKAAIRAVDAHTRAEDEACRKVREALPIGTRLTWYTQRGESIYHHGGHVVGYGLRPGHVVVENVRTGKRVTVYLGRHGNVVSEG